MFELTPNYPVRWHVVDVGNNRALAEPFAVELQLLTAREFEQEEKLGALELFTDDLDKTQPAKAHAAYKRLITKHVLNIVNFEVKRESGDPIKPKNGKELIETLEDPSLYIDHTIRKKIYTDITNALYDTSKISELVIPH